MIQVKTGRKEVAIDNYNDHILVTAIFNPVVQMTASKQPVYCAQLPAIFQD
jgi:hypothetical protein